MGTSLAAGIALSVAIAEMQLYGVPNLGSFVMAMLASLGVVFTLGKEFRHHPERRRFVGWWLAFLVTKVAFSPEGFWVVLPIELLALIPALRSVQRASIVRQPDLREAEMAEADVAFIHFKGADFQRANLRKAVFTDIVFEGCSFNGVEAEGVVFQRCKFYNCQFMDARLMGSQWRHSDAKGCFFERAWLQDAAFDAVDLRTADFENADLRGAKFQELEMVRTRLEGARLAAARYDGRTVWSPDAQPSQAGAQRVD